MHHYAIIGYPLTHSLSPTLWNEYFHREGIDADYVSCPIADIAEAVPLLESYDGLNVTIPYKQTIMPYLKRIDDVANEIGAVNTIHHGVGYNTDWIGFRDSLQSFISSTRGELVEGTCPEPVEGTCPEPVEGTRPEPVEGTCLRALVLGTGGVSKAVQYALRTMNIAYTLVSRSKREGVLCYDELTKDDVVAHHLIVHCTPLGMSPNEDSCPPIPYDAIGKEHYLFDCVYTPKETMFLKRGRTQGAATRNGMEMLHKQAQAAAEIWGRKRNENV